MGILDGKFVPDDGRNNGSRNGGNDNNNRGNNKNRNKNKKRNRDEFRQRRNFSDGGDYNFHRSSYLNDDDDNDYEDNRPNNEEHDRRADSIYEFCNNFTDNVDNYKSLQDIIIEDFPDVIPYIKQYYNVKNSPKFQDALNKLILIICTDKFSKALISILEARAWEGDVYNNIWDSIGFGVSVALETNHERMHSDTIRMYVTRMIPRLYKTEINELRTQTGVTGDLALDLIIAIPIGPNDWNGATIDAFYERFLDKMLIHAEDNMDILNWEVQGMLYEKFFGKTKTALKVIGKYLTTKAVSESDNVVVNAVYEEFQKMLYSKLDKYDISDIEYVMSFVAKKRQENPDDIIIYNSVKASQYENVRKGLMSLMDRVPATMKYLA